jgi:hypothetical protein
MALLRESGGGGRRLSAVAGRGGRGAGGGGGFSGLLLPLLPLLLLMLLLLLLSRRAAMGRNAWRGAGAGRARAPRTGPCFI